MHDPIEQKLRPTLGDTSRQFELLLNSVTDYAIYMLDTQGYVRSWNPGGERIKGYSADEIIGSHFSRFYDPEEAAAGVPAKNLETARVEGRYSGEGWRFRKDGSRFHASVVIDPIWQAGELLGFAKITRDVTERYEAEQRLEEARQTLLQAQKMEAVGKLTLGLAHDFNNLLTIILNSLDAIDSYADDERISRLVDSGTRASERGIVLTRQLLAFGRGQKLAPEYVDVNALIEADRDLFRRCAGDTVTIRHAPTPQLPPVYVDKAQLEAALLNLVSNSRDAMPSGGTITITTAPSQAVNPDAGPGGHGFVEITVTDTGTGIPTELLERVFEPFFTTKDVGRGSGLGLSQIFGFASQSGGQAKLDSTPGQGTRVTLILPIAGNR